MGRQLPKPSDAAQIAPQTAHAQASCQLMDIPPNLPPLFGQPWRPWRLATSVQNMNQFAQPSHQLKNSVPYQPLPPLVQLLHLLRLAIFVQKM
jgi:hypothetical protein